MEKYRPLKRIAADLGIAEIRIWILIRKGRIAKKLINGITHIDSNELSDFIKAHPNLLNLWRENLKTTQRNYCK